MVPSDNVNIIINRIKVISEIIEATIFKASVAVKIFDFSSGVRGVRKRRAAEDIRVMMGSQHGLCMGTSKNLPLRPLVKFDLHNPALRQR
jgi:hypothetical protein